MQNSKTTPPNVFLRFFRWFCHPGLRDPIEGDLMELYREKVRSSGKRKADLAFILDVLLLFRPGIIRTANGFYHVNNTAMLRSYFKIAWRNLLRNKGYSSINIIGLSTGMAIAMLIGLWVWDEVTFNSFFQNRDRLAQVMILQTDKGEAYTGTTVAIPVGDALRTRYAADFKAVSLASWNNGHTVSVEGKNLSTAGMWVQRDFPEMFTLTMQSGNRDALKDPSTLLLSAALAKALFGDADPLNKTVRIDNRLDMIVGGVYQDFPENTSFYDTRFLLPWDNKANWMNTQTEWDDHSGQLFVQLNDRASVGEVSAKIKNLPTPYVKGWKEEIMLHPMERVHLYNEFDNGKEAGGRIRFVWLFGTIGVFVLLLACINFMNLSTARSEKRAKEVGIRKTIGSAQRQLVAQFLSESVVVALLSFVFAIILAQSALPLFNTLAHKRIVIPWQMPEFWLLAVGFTLFTGILSGSYPAFYLSAFKPVKVLKGTFRAGRLALIPRKALVVVQFTVSLTLIIGTTVVVRQIEYARDRPAGYAREGLITVPVNTPDLERHYRVVQNELLQSGVVQNVAESSQSPAHFSNNTTVEWSGKDPGLMTFFRNVTITPEFGSTVGWTVKAGRDFSTEILSDSSSVIINETAAKIIGFKDPVGQVVQYDGKDFRIIGVVNDLVTQSPYEPVEPVIFFQQGWVGVITIRIKPGIPVNEALAKIEPVFKKYNPGAPFQFSFVDEVYGRKFDAEKRVASLAGVFAILAIFISCLGLFGLSSFVAEQRTKEIGIRKVMGASVASLWKLLSKDFVVLVIISLGIATPITWYFMHDWLLEYQYRSPLSWWVFVVGGAGLMAVALVTVSFQALKAAVANPVRSLRSE